MWCSVGLVQLSKLSTLIRNVESGPIYKVTKKMILISFDLDGPLSLISSSLLPGEKDADVDEEVTSPAEIIESHTVQSPTKPGLKSPLVSPSKSSEGKKNICKPSRIQVAKHICCLTQCIINI